MSAKLLQSCLTLCNPWTVACQVPLSKGFTRQEYWSGVPWIEPVSLESPAPVAGFFTTSTTWEAHSTSLMCKLEGQIFQKVIKTK